MMPMTLGVWVAMTSVHSPLHQRDAVLRTIWTDGRIPMQRSVPDHQLPVTNTTGATWLIWDITGVDGHPMNATAWYHPIRSGSRTRTLMLTHEGHDNAMSVSANFSTWVHHTLGCDYIHLWMPLYGPNQQHGYPPHHSFFAKWEAEGVRTLRYFLEPTALATNFGLASGYEAVHATGISGGGWTVTVAAAIDPRLVISLPLAGSLPWVLFPDHSVADFEQRPQPDNPSWYLSAANFTALYLLSALEPGRVSVQVLHEDDECCFHGRGRHKTILGYDRSIGVALQRTGGGTFSTAISQWRAHEWDERSRTIIAAARREAMTNPRRPRLDLLPCDILHHLPSAVPCNAAVDATAAMGIGGSGGGGGGGAGDHGGGGGDGNRDLGRRGDFAPDNSSSAHRANGFVHPGILLSASMLTRLRERVRCRVEPTISSYEIARVGATIPYGPLPSVDLGSLWYVGRPQELTTANKTANVTAIDIFREDGFAAYTHALLYAATADDRHAALAAALMDGWATAWTVPVGLEYGLQIAWAAAVWPRAAEIVRHAWPAGWPGAEAFGAMLRAMVLPMVDEGASTNGNIGLVMTEAMAAIAVFTDDRPTFESAIARWRGQAAAYLYVASDGPTPRRPPAQRYLAHTSPVCDPSCNDTEMVAYWHGQAVYGYDGLCQETCRDLGHVQLGFATLVNTAETAFHQGIDLYAEEQSRLISAAELHASLLRQEPPPHHQPVPPWLCQGKLRLDANGSTWDMLRHHYTGRRGVPLPKVSALLHARGERRDFCWDHMCWETFTHGGLVSENASAS